MPEIIIEDQVIRYEAKNENFHLEDSYKIKDDNIKRKVVHALVTLYPEYNRRSEESLVTEWKAHNILYEMHIKTDRTKDADLNMNESL